MESEIGDIIGYKPEATDSIVAGIIKIGGKQRYSHVLMHMGDGQVIEAGAKGVGIGGDWVTWKPKDMWKIMRLKGGLRDDQKEKLLAVAYGYNGRQYDFLHYPLIFVYVWLSKYEFGRKILKAFKKLDNDYAVNCSELISRIYKEGIGYNLGDEEIHDFVLPDDIMDNPDLEEVI